MTKLGPCRVFTPKQRRKIADEFCKGKPISAFADESTIPLYSDALEAVEDAIRWVFNNGWKPKKRSKR